MTSAQLFRVGFTLLFVQMSCITLTLMKVSYFEMYDTPYWLMFALLVFWIIYCIQPVCKCGYRRARYQLFYTLWQILISPFGKVRFRYFFMADVITSVPSALTDASVAAYYFMTPRFYHHTPIDRTSLFLVICAQIAAIIPFWWRFW